MTEPDHPEPSQKRITAVYGLFAASLILSALPNITAAGLSFILLLVTMVAAYVLKSRAAPDSLLHNHMIFLIRTIWIAGLFALFTMGIGLGYLYLAGLNIEPMLPCSKQILALGPEASNRQAYAAVMPCVMPFLTANLQAFIVAGIITIAPILLYLLMRLSRGLSRARGGYRIAHPLWWF